MVEETATERPRVVYIGVLCTNGTPYIYSTDVDFCVAYPIIN